MSFESTPDSLSQPLRACVCPRCGAANHCAPAASGSFDVPCWCTRVVVSRRALSEVPTSLRGKACLCPACAALSESSAEGGTNDA
ncbi:MAG: cysteine-rich CWC family protein [Burkholderiaceae bacterium]|nr:cysteine-rich CWC family protein [Burkholderiaceae bacterium]